MSKIIKITADYKSTDEYHTALSETIAKLESIEEDLQGLVVNLATTGKWKEWSDKVPDGAEFEFTEEMLKDTGDENVNAITGLIDEVIRVRRNITTIIS